MPDLVNDPDLRWFNEFANSNAAKADIGWVGFPLLLSALYFWHGCCWRRALCRATPAEGGLYGDVRTIETSGRCMTCARRLRLLLASSYCFAVYYFYLPVALTWMSTALVNSATHIFGDSPFQASAALSALAALVTSRV